MNEILKNKKLVIIFIIAFLVTAFFVVFMNKKNDSQDEFLDSNVENITEISKTNDEENESSGEDEYIYIHILGEVKNQGFLKLPER